MNEHDIAQERYKDLQRAEMIVNAVLTAFDKHENYDGTAKDEAVKEVLKLL